MIKISIITITIKVQLLITIVTIIIIIVTTAIVKEEMIINNNANIPMNDNDNN